MDFGLTDRVVVVTGGCSGIGLATTEAFVAEGAVVVCGDVRPLPPLGASGPGKAVGVLVDLSNADGPATLIDAALAEFGRVEVLVNNVGLAPYRHGFLDVSDADWHATLEINLFSAVRATRAALPPMIE